MEIFSTFKTRAQALVSQTLQTLTQNTPDTTPVPAINLGQSQKREVPTPYIKTASISSFKSEKFEELTEQENGIKKNLLKFAEEASISEIENLFANFPDIKKVALKMFDVKNVESLNQPVTFQADGSGVSFYKTHLNRETKEGNLTAVKILLSLGAAQGSLYRSSPSTLAQAVINGHLQIARLLIQQKAELYSVQHKPSGPGEIDPNFLYQTPLSYALKKRDLAMVGLIVEHTNEAVMEEAIQAAKNQSEAIDGIYAAKIKEIIKATQAMLATGTLDHDQLAACKHLLTISESLTHTPDEIIEDRQLLVPFHKVLNRVASSFLAQYQILKDAIYTNDKNSIRLIVELAEEKKCPVVLSLIRGIAKKNNDQKTISYFSKSTPLN